MGQYYQFINFDKKEFIYPHDYNSGLKLMEYSYVGDNYIDVVMTLLNSHWATDMVLNIGDYTMVDNLVKNLTPSARNILNSLAKKYHLKNDESFWDILDREGFKKINPQPAQTPYKYLINDKKECFVDIYKMPKFEVPTFYGSKIYQQIHPLPLLLCTSNGLGGGDYFGINEEKVGLWVEDAGSIYSSNERPDGFADITDDLQWTEGR